MIVDYSNILKVAVSCEAGIGASVMGAAVLSKLMVENNLDIKVDAVAIRKLTDDYDLIITHSGFKPVIELRNIRGQVMYIDNYLDMNKYKELIVRIIDA